MYVDDGKKEMFQPCDRNMLGSIGFDWRKIQKWSTWDYSDTPIPAEHVEVDEAQKVWDDLNYPHPDD